MALAETGVVAVGVDVSESYLEGARRHCSHTSITYEHGDIRQTRFADGAFDAAVSTLVLDVIPEARQVVTEMRRVVRPGGIVAAGVHDYWGFSNFSMVWDTGATIDESISALRDVMKGHPLCTAGGQAAMWRQEGLVDVTEIPIVVNCDYPSFADYWGTFTSGQGHLSSLIQKLAADARGSIERYVRSRRPARHRA